MKTFWVKVLLRDGRGRMTGAVAHCRIVAPSADAAVKEEAVIYAQDRVWSTLDRSQHGAARLETVVVEIVERSVDHYRLGETA